MVQNTSSEKQSSSELSLDVLRKTLVVGASSGGHVNELLVLLKAAKDIWPIQPAAYVTTMAISSDAFPVKGPPVHILGEADRTKKMGSLKVAWRALRTAYQLKPDIVVTTGSGPLALFCLWARILGAQIVWIDSVAQVDRMSLSGRLMRPVAHLRLVQWPNLTERHPGTEYVGELY